MSSTILQQEEDAVGTLTYPQIEMEPTTVEPMVSPETKTRLKPSEAVRLGRLEVPLKMAGHLIVRDHKGDILGACALGAMWIGYDGKDEVNKTYTKESFWWPDGFKNPYVDYPCGCTNTGSRDAKTVVAHVNDTHIAVDKPLQTWSEEKLAAWMDTLPLT